MSNITRKMTTFVICNGDTVVKQDSVISIAPAIAGGPVYKLLSY